MLAVEGSGQALFGQCGNVAGKQLSKLSPIKDLCLGGQKYVSKSHCNVRNIATVTQAINVYKNNKNLSIPSYLDLIN